MEWSHEIPPYPSGDDSLSTTAFRYDQYSGNPYMASSPYYPVNDYMAPPNDQLPAYVAGEYHPHSDMAHFRCKMGYPAMSSSHPWASVFTGHSRTSYSSNTSSISTRDSMSPGLPEETVISTFHSPGTVFGSPTVSHSSIPNCRGVALRDVQGISDTIVEERIIVAGTQDLSTEFVDTGLPTPASETGMGSVDTARGMTFDYGVGYREEDPREHLSSPRKSGRTKSKAAPSKTVNSHSRQLSNGKIHKKGPRRSSTSGRKSVAANSCPECRMDCKNEAGLERHLQKAHVRPFSCIFDRYGCKATFGAKNEWKRHCSTQHLRLSFYRCDVGACSTQSQQEHRQLPDWDLPIAAAESCNDFNRKDLFIQHHRRMHAPEGYKESNQDEKDRFKAQCERVAQRCRVSARAPPPRTICGLCEAKGCPVVFEGVRAWETRMEHVGRHLENEKGDKTAWVEDEHLKQWLIQEGLIQRDARGDWRLTDHMVPEEGRGSRRSSHK